MANRWTHCACRNFVKVFCFVFLFSSSPSISDIHSERIAESGSTSARCGRNNGNNEKNISKFMVTKPFVWVRACECVREGWWGGVCDVMDPVEFGWTKAIHDEVHERYWMNASMHKWSTKQINFPEHIFVYHLRHPAPSRLSNGMEWHDINISSRSTEQREYITFDSNALQSLAQEWCCTWCNWSQSVVDCVQSARLHITMAIDGELENIKVKISRQMPSSNFLI